MNRKRTHRRGVAMLMVLGVIVIAAVLGYAMLASASIQRQVSSNSAASASAAAMAESGVNLAIYYLHSPEKWKDYPTTYPETETYDRNGTYWTGTGGQFIDFGSAGVGSVKVAVVRPDPLVRWQYNITSVGRAAGSTLERTVKSTVWVNAEYQVKHSAVFTGDVMLPAGATLGQNGLGNGSVYGNGVVQIRTGGKVYGTGTRRKTPASAVAPQNGWRTPVPIVPQVVPKNLGEVRNYLQYEMPAGTSRNAVTLTASAIGMGQALDRLDRSASNPAGIFYAPGNFTLKKNSDVRGTLIVNGNLTIDGSNIRVHEAEAGFPALLVKGDLFFSLPILDNSELTVEGLCWVGGKIDALALAPTLNVTGSLMVNGTTPIFPLTLGGRLNLIYDPAKTALPDFSQIGRTPVSVKVLSWQGR